jgi:hypothetical protein
MTRFPEAIDITTYWGRVLEAAIIDARRANGATTIEG